MSYRFFVPGPLPGQNEIVDAAKGCGGKGYGYASMKAKWTGDIVMHILAARVPKGLKRIRCEFDWVSTEPRRDPDNIEAGQKFVWDALSKPRKGKPGASIIDDDDWNGNAGSSHQHTIGPRPGVWVTVVPVEPL